MVRNTAPEHGAGARCGSGVRVSDDVQGIAVPETGGLAPGGAIRLLAERTGWSAAITVFRDGDDFFALDDTCSHAEASLADGYVEDGCVECPLHGALFRLSDGAALTLPAVRPVRTHRVEVVDGTVRLYPGTAA
jgi:nitrite reductase/ring-hydroxylating ferredoxin subunit